jgi:hypothetical protein
LLSNVRVYKYSNNVFFKKGMISDGFKIERRHKIVNAISYTSGIGSFIHKNNFLKLFGEFK